MSKHNETGVKGEQEAAKFLLKKGYTLLHRNWCSGKKEVDLILKKEDTVVFVEVKTRTGSGFGFPEDAVDLRKQGYLKEAAADFLDKNENYRKLQFDIVSVHMTAQGRVASVVHFEDAFY